MSTGVQLWIPVVAFHIRRMCVYVCVLTVHTLVLTACMLGQMLMIGQLLRAAACTQLGYINVQSHRLDTIMLLIIRSTKGSTWNLSAPSDSPQLPLWVWLFSRRPQIFPCLDFELLPCTTHTHIYDIMLLRSPNCARAGGRQLL